MKIRVYASCVRSSMTYGSETRPLLVDVGLKFERAEMQMIRWMCGICTKRIQPARGWCATVGGNTVQMYPLTPPLRRPGHPVFWGNRPCVPAAWLAERLLLAGNIESNPGPKPTLKTLTSYTHTDSTPTLTKYTSSSIQPPRTRPPPLSLVHPPPKTSTSVQPQRPPLALPLQQPPHSRPNTTYTSRHSPPHKLLYVATPTTPTPAHSHTRNKQKTSKTKHRDKNSSTQRKRHKEHRGRT